MAKDFRAEQVRLGKLIGEGGSDGYVQFYSSSNASNYDGSITDDNTSIGSDVWLLISGSSNSEYHGKGRLTGSMVLFAGDVVISGTLFAERQVIEVDESVVGNFFVPNALYVSGAATFNATESSTADVKILSTTGSNLFFADVSADKVGIGTASPTYELDVVGDIGLSRYLYHNDDADTFISFTDDKITLEGGSYELLTLIENGSSSRVVVNEDGNDVDFIVESADETHMLFVDAANNRVGIGDNAGAPTATLEVRNNASAGAFNVPLVVLTSNDVDQVTLDINAGTTTATVVDVTGHSTTGGQLLSLESNSLTTGKAFVVNDNSSDTGTRDTVLLKQNHASAIAATALKIQSDGGVIGVDIDKNYSDTTAATLYGFRLDMDKTGASTSDNSIYGLTIDCDNTTATDGTNSMFGLWSSPTLTHASDSGTSTIKAGRFIATGGTNGTSTTYGLDVTATGADTNIGLQLKVDNGGTDIKLLSSADTSDYFSISTTTNGATTILTNDGGGTSADMQITANGALELDGTTITLDSSGDIVLDAAGDDVILKDSGTDIAHFTASSSNLIISASVSDKDVIFKASTGGSSLEIGRIDGSGSSLLMGSNRKIEFGSTASSISGDGTDVDLTSTGNVNVTSTVNEANAVLIKANGGTSETINLRSFLGTGATSVQLRSDSGGITITAGSTAHGIVLGDISGAPVSIGHTTSETTVNDNLTVTGDLTVNGTTTTVSTTNILIEDPIIGMAAGAASQNQNGGIAIFSGSSDSDLVLGRVANDTWGAGKKATLKGAVTTLADMTLVSLRAGKYEIDSTNVYLDGGEGASLTGSASADIFLDAAGDIILDADGANVTIKDNGTTTLDIVSNGTTDVKFDAPGDIKFDAAGNDYIFDPGGTESFRFTANGATSSTWDVEGIAKIDAGGDFIVDVDGSDVIFRDSDVMFLMFTSASAGPEIKPGLGGDTIFKDAGGTEIFRVDSSADSILVAGTKKIEFGSAAAYINHDGTDLQLVDDADINVKPAIDFLVDAGGDIILDAAGNNVTLKTGGTTALDFVINGATDIKLDAPGDIKFDAAGNDYIFDPGGTESFRFTANGTTNATWDVAGDAIIDAAGGDIEFKADETSLLKISNSSSDIVFQPQVSNKDLIFNGQDGSEVFRLDSSADTLRVADESKIILGGTDYDGDGIGENAIWSASNKLHISGTQVLFMSGGAAASMDIGPDVNFFVSGTTSSKDSSVKGTALFGGDLMVSGGLTVEGTVDFSTVSTFTIATAGTFRFGDSNVKIVRDGTDLEFTDQQVGTKTLSQLASSTQNVTAAFFIQHDDLRSTMKTTASVSFDTGGNYTNSIGNDVYFFVSGAIGMKDDAVLSGTAVFGGDVVLSGATYMATASFGHLGAPTETVLLMKANQANHFNIDQAVADKDIRFRVNDSDGGGQGQTCLTLKGDTQAVRVDAGSQLEVGGVTRYLHSSASTALEIVNNNNSGHLNLLAGTSGTPGTIQIRGSIIPTQNESFNLGTDDLRWANIYTGDLHLKNERGDWTIVEEEDMLIVRNNKTGKRYKMMLETLEDDE